MQTAHRLQSEMTGAFIGATAIATDGRVHGYDFGPDCPDARRVHIRLVWKADAGFPHGGGIGEPPAGPRKAELMTVDPHTGGVRDQGAQYRGVGAEPGETLLYGDWPGESATVETPAWPTNSR